MKSSIGERLQDLIDHEGITQEELARKIRVDKTNVNKWFRGKSKPRKSSLKRVVKEYKCSFLWLNRGDEPMFPEDDYSGDATGNITGDNNVQSGNITAGGDVVQENMLAQRLGPDLIKLAELIVECESPLRIRAMIAEYEEMKKNG